MLAISLTKQLLHISAAAKAISESLGQNSQKWSKEKGGRDSGTKRRESGSTRREIGTKRREGRTKRREGGTVDHLHVRQDMSPLYWASCHLRLLPMLSSKVATRRMVDCMSTINLLVR